MGPQIEGPLRGLMLVSSQGSGSQSAYLVTSSALRSLRVSSHRLSLFFFFFCRSCPMETLRKGLSGKTRVP